jgi:ketosteroid isomerase-like protein
MSINHKPSAMEHLGSRAADNLKLGAPLGVGPSQPDAAMQRRLAQLRTAMGDAPEPETRRESTVATDLPPPDTAPATTSSGRHWPALLLLGVASLAAAWALRPQADTDTMATSAPMAATPTPTATPAAAALVAAPPPPTETPVVAADLAPAIVAANTPATEPPAAEVQPVLVPPDQQVLRTVEAWREDWAQRDMMAYLDHYGEDFTPAGGVSRREWIASRYRNVGGRQAIEVQIQALKVESLSGDRARVSFLQDYTSGSYRETAQPKTLDLVRDADDRWRIVGEWQGEPPPLDNAGNS